MECPLEKKKGEGKERGGREKRRKRDERPGYSLSIFSSVSCKRLKGRKRKGGKEGEGRLSAF